MALFSVSSDSRQGNETSKSPIECTEGKRKERIKYKPEYMAISKRMCHEANYI